MKTLPLIGTLIALLAPGLVAQDNAITAPGGAAPLASAPPGALIGSPSEGAAVLVGTCRRIQSVILHEERTLLIRVPADYGSVQRRYPVLYTLDGDRTVFLQTLGTVEYLADWEQAPDCIVVGIANADRARDMLPERGADQFVRFLAEELVPFIDANYRTTNLRILSGQSMSSVFTLYAGLRAPDLFDGFVLGSFGLSEDHARRLAEELARRAPDPNRHHWIYIGNARTDPYDPDGSHSRRGLAFLERLKQTEGSALEVECRVFDDQGHVPFPTLHYALRWMAKAKAGRPEQAPAP